MPPEREWEGSEFCMGPAQVNRKQVALLEFVLKFCTREDTAIMARRWLF